MMKFCTACGHELGAGRFCTNCGTPISKDPETPYDDDFRTGTAERIAIAASEPYVAPPPPEAPTEPPSDYRGRFPLFADDAAKAEHEPTALRQPFGHTHLAAPRQAEEWPAAPPPPANPPPPEPAPYAFSWEEPQQRRSRPRISPLVAVMLAMVLVVGVFGIWLLTSDSPDDTDQVGINTGESRNSSATPSNDDSQAPADDVEPPANPSELASTADPKTPVTSPPSEDLLGNMVSFRAANMTDGVDSTAWRMPGSGAGQVLTFRLPSEAVLTQVGLINGYAKIGRDEKGHKTDWYDRNRKVTQVTWLFDDGTSVTQDLASTTSMQTIDIDPVRTTVIRLKLVTVTNTPPKGRNYTPISEVTLVGG